MIITVSTIGANPVNPFISLEEMRKFSDEELITIINELLVPPVLSGVNRTLLVDRDKAQFYLAELDGRENRRANLERDRIETERHRVNLALELLIVLLIGLELWFGWHEGGKQLDALNHIVQSMSATAAIQQATQKDAEATAAVLGDLKTTMDKMNGGIQNQLDLNYVVSVGLMYNNVERRLKVTNIGKTTIYW